MKPRKKWRKHRCAAALISVFGWRWMPAETKKKLLRRTFEFNEKGSQIFYRPQRLAPEFARERASEPSVNDGEGMSAVFNPQSCRLQVVGLANPRAFPQYTDNIAYETPMNGENEMKETDIQHRSGDAKEKPTAPAETPPSMDRATPPQMPMPGLLLTLDDNKHLPPVEMTTVLKCIEGWGVVVNWAGARFSDFIRQYQPQTRNGNAPDTENQPENLAQYISMVMPDGGYYVGLDMPSAMHPQTLLCYEMNGAPLRLVTPTKYGIKQIKCIGRITFTSERPADYWGERGYDWYAGH